MAAVIAAAEGGSSVPVLGPVLSLSILRLQTSINKRYSPFGSRKRRTHNVQCVEPTAPSSRNLGHPRPRKRLLQLLMISRVLPLQYNIEGDCIEVPVAIFNVCYHVAAGRRDAESSTSV
jgi:hypothetical protein